MDDTIWYLNTDLELTSPEDLSALTAALVSRGMYSLMEPTKGQDGRWRATFEIEANMDFSEPEQHITAMLNAIESLDEPLRAMWSGCSVREFNIGYDCGSKPWAFNQGLSNELLTRMSAIGASLRITIYPNRDNDGSAQAQGVCA